MGEETDIGVLTLATQGSITFIGNILGKVLGFVFVAVATRLVTPSEYGVFTLALSLVMFAQGFASLNIYRAVDYFIPQFLSESEFGLARRTLRNVFAIGICSSLLGAGALYLLGERLAVFFNEPELALVLPVFVLLMPLQTAHQTLVSSFNSIKKMKYRVAMQNVLNPLVRILAAISLVSVGAGLFGLVGGYFIGLGVAVLCGILFLVYEADWVRKGRSANISNRSLLSYSLPLVLAGVIYSLVGQIDYFVIGYFLGSAEVAQYRVAFLLASNLLIVLTAITPVFKPMVAESQDDTGLLERRYRLVTRWVTMLTIPLVVVLILAPEVYLSTLFTDEYAGAGGAVIALAVGYLFNASFGPEGMILEGLGHTRLTLLNTVVLVGINGLLDIFLVPRYGILGAGVATGSALALAGFLGIIEIYSLRSIHPFSTQLISIGSAAIPSFGAGFLVMSVGLGRVLLFFSVPIIVVVVYLISLYFAVDINENDRIILSNILQLVQRKG